MMNTMSRRMVLDNRSKRGTCPLGFAPINFVLSRSDVENLLAGFLAETLAVELETRLIEPSEVPAACRKHIRRAAASGRAWTAWSTPCGPIAAWEDYYIQGSQQINAYLLFVEWWGDRSGHHSLWCYCDPKRPTEWTVGRGWLSEQR